MHRHNGWLVKWIAKCALHDKHIVTTSQPFIFETKNLEGQLQSESSALHVTHIYVYKYTISLELWLSASGRWWSIVVPEKHLSSMDLQ